MNTRTVRVPKIRMVAALAVAAGSSVLFAGSAAAAADAPDDYRYSGSDRYATAAAISEELHPAEDCEGGGRDITVVNGENFPDGLAASVFGDSILLTKANSIPAATAAEVARLGECYGELDITVVGGTSAVSESVYGQLAVLAGDDSEMERISGADRYGTAVAVAEDWGSGWNCFLEDCGWTVILTTGANFPDALAAGPLAAELDAPILLNDGSAVRADVAAFLVEDGVERVIIVGGTAAVPQSVEDELESFYDLDVTRLSGANRAATAVEVAEFMIEEIDSDYDDAVTLVNQNGFADALAASTLAYWWEGPILMVNADSIPAETAAFHLENCADIDEIWAIGGEQAISDAVVDGAVDAATCGTPAVTSVTMAISDETARTIVLDGGACGGTSDGSSGEITLTAVTPGVVANEYSITFIDDPVPANWGAELVGYNIDFTDNFESLDEATFVSNWNASDAAALFTASGAVALDEFTEAPCSVEPFDDGGEHDDTLGLATMTIVVNFNIAVDDSSPMNWDIYTGSNPSTGSYLLDDGYCDSATFAEDGLSYTCTLEDWDYLTDSSAVPEPRIGIDSFRIDSDEFYAEVGGEWNDAYQVVTLSAP